MRFVRKKSRSPDEEQSASSSYQSADSDEIFGGVCSDSSDCDERKPVFMHMYERLINSNSAYGSYCSAMDMESSPLLGGGTPPFYKTNTPDTSDSLGPAELSSDEILTTYKKQFEKPGGKKQSSLVTIFSVWNTIMGSSLLTMAWGVERAGLPTAIVLVAVMAALCLYTAYVLLTVNKYHGCEACEVPALCRTLLGLTAERVAHVFSLLVLFGANIVYWILITNFLYFTVNYFTDLDTSNTTEYDTSPLCPNGGANGSLIIPAAEHDTPYWGLHTTVPIFAAFIVFPLLNFKNVRFFTRFNSLGTLSVVYLLVFVIVKGYIWGINMSAVSPSHGRDAAVLSGMLALSFYIHNIIITIMANNAKQEKNGRDLTIAFVLVTLTYTLVGGVFYVCFPLAKSCIEDNILNNFEMHDVMTAVARILLLFQVVTVYPLVAFMLRCEVLLLLPVHEEWKTRRLLTIAINVTIVTVCILFACFCPSIGTIIRYTGAVSGLVHVFALPSLLHTRSLYLRGELTWWKTAFYAIIVLFGAINLLMQFFISE